MTEDEDEDFERLLAEKQHREFMGSIKSLVEVLQKLESSDTLVTNSIQKHSERVSQLLNQIATLPQPESPDIYLNQDPVVAAIKDLCKEFRDLTESLNNKKPVEWEFKVERGYGNNIEKITAKPK